jgi:hypothetical protein
MQGAQFVQIQNNWNNFLPGCLSGKCEVTDCVGVLFSHRLRKIKSHIKSLLVFSTEFVSYLAHGWNGKVIQFCSNFCSRFARRNQTSDSRLKLANVTFHLNLLHSELISQIDGLAGAAMFVGRNDNLGIAACFENVLEGKYEV